MNEIYSEKESLCFLQMLTGFYAKQIDMLKTHFGTYAKAVTADESALKKVIKPEFVTSLVTERELKGVPSACADLKSRGIGYCVAGDEDYPRRLLGIKDMPLSLFYMGELPDEDRPSVAIIGARNCSGYGRQMAREFAREIGSAGIQVISGMALGIDGIAQKGALSTGGRSFGVLGCGVDICYPQSNHDLYDELKTKGGIISEYRPGTEPIARLFPERNRIISGLSDAVLVIEARERSGTLITVSMALDQGREIYALPGRVTDSLSTGCNRLIWEGATPLVRPYDFVDDFLKKTGFTCNVKKGKKKGRPETSCKSYDERFLTSNERKILSVLGCDPKSAGEIIYDMGDECDIPISEVLCLLTQMTARHMIDCIDGSHYVNLSPR